MKKKLFIIGNGFDLAHDVKSDYLYFKKYVYEKAYEPSKDLPNFTGKDGIADFLNEKDWEDLRVISDFDISSLPEEYELDNQEWNQMCYQLLAEAMSNTVMWSNFEEDLVRLVKPDIDIDLVLDREGDVDGLKSERNIEDLGSRLTPIVEAINILFSSWIEETYHNWKSFISSNRINTYTERISKETITLHRESYFLTFNYTTILEDLYGIPNDNIYHIHGQIGEEIIFGHKGDDKEQDNPLHISYHTGELTLQFQKPVKEILGRTRTKVFFEKIAEIEEIYFIGVGAIKTDIDNNYPGVDDPYFEKIFEVIPDVDIYIDSFDKENKVRIMKKLGIWGANRAEQLRFVDTDRDIIINQTR